MPLTTIVAASVLGLFALLIGLFGNSLDEDENDFYRGIMFAVAAGAGWIVFCLSHPAGHMEDLRYIGDHTALAIFFVLIAKAVFDILFEGMKAQLRDVLEVVGICALIGSVGMKAREVAAHGAQPNLHAANIWLMIAGYLCLLALIIGSVLKGSWRTTTAESDTKIPNGPRHRAPRGRKHP